MKSLGVIKRKEFDYTKVTFLDGEVVYFLSDALAMNAAGYNLAAMKYSEYAKLSLSTDKPAPFIIKVTRNNKKQSLSNPLEEEDVYDDPLN